ncbi:1-(5-phosphoribosyl)-5-[(5-phosphoribosylamino)methylideneamino]imidazole-4-carboxamide isomerase [Pyruvatibacter mobilis]|uniref:1-(5-phosphoribosyl)-5-[(5-phosphoribosylamino)methylideneamino] imidazole-4-carboxamide isomerase n=1 Tax=Pyruvatibacter mobilis TaxID=1712261 RepID=A0A845Q8Y7_9HYPH|nr:1-(5-phosphoribosyl)-5-[(5-phosphoribosylamino)methylideneamino]imidazole-4-carboxamide isomerase [Pyruvatibacter mobilis]NBG95125.1 1-(5-phosphoribosyl)-5-[(5-phosphoribosylamino)methylideneamino]imidazole-4-carboxamide isomerase [Pyruvatibacter mobilis]QJD76310.1 1-(5-phosphoribosyl)-5-[(5-phosphoribosylamino)methylideneamino]imidazole-4-carboxamide isomerase [Pyruvatibacter mobilis]GGD23052.1 1-(5-phosphoribosyl)-5-[(5-phosphoribosylamino) methylideneamino] imidazole-4-carboxamide isomeras
MILFPAIDLKDGQCVRLVQGDMDRATVFSDTPAEQAKVFENQGFEWLHLVDLNGAFEGKPVNGDAVEAILKTVSLPAQLGGGIRSMQQIEAWLDKGIARVILGTAALRDPQLVIEACKTWPGKIAVGVDAKDGYVAVEGWAEVSDIQALDLAKRFEDAGVAALIYTDISRDGAMRGMNVAGTAELANSVGIPVIASGGVTNLDDLHALKAANAPGIIGVISGRAIYDGRLDPAEALAVLKGNDFVLDS